MIKTELLTIDNRQLIKHYAEDENGKQYKIKQIETGIVYDGAIDVLPCRYTYEETNEEIEVLEEEQPQP